jgi:hypothetical protein
MKQMKLLTAELRRLLPPLRAQDGTANPVVHAKFFTPDSSWTWWATEGEPEDSDYRFFGFVRGPLGQPVERDLNFKEGPFHDVVPAPDF